MALIQPLDLERIFTVDVAGTPEIFTFLSILMISVIMGKFNLPSKVALPLFALFGVMMATYMSGVYLLIILLAGMVTFYSLAKMVR